MWVCFGRRRYKNGWYFDNFLREVVTLHLSLNVGARWTAFLRDDKRYPIDYIVTNNCPF